VEQAGHRLYLLHITAVISPGWQLYSQHQPEEAVAMPTTIRFNKDSMLDFKGLPWEKGKLEQFFQPETDIADNRYSGRVEFIQEIALTGFGPVQLTGEITYQACRNEECLPPGVTRFSIRLPG
jgi:hypothetical protein